MKYFLVSIFLVCTFFLFAGCSSDQYGIERSYWQIQKQADRIFGNPEASPPLELQKLVSRLDSFSAKYPKSNLAIDADFTSARLYIVKSEFDSARSKLRSIIDKYNNSPSVCVEALFLIGNTYELQDKWSLASEQYKKIIREYPQTQRGLDMPVYIVQHYKIKDQPEKMNIALQEAVAHYNLMAEKYPNTRLALSSYLLAAQCYGQLNDWRSAVNTYEIVLSKFKNKINLSGVLFESALIYDQQIKDKSKAQSALSQIISEYP